MQVIELKPKLSRDYFKLKLYVIEQFIKFKFSILATVRGLNKIQKDIKFNKANVLNLVFDYCKENTIVPSDYTVSKWENILKSYTPDLFQDFYKSTEWRSSDEFLNNVLNKTKTIDKNEVESLCGAVFKRSIASHLISIEMVEQALKENDFIYKKRIEFIDQAKIYRLENESFDDEQLANLNITFETEKMRYYKEYIKIKNDLLNTLAKLNGLSMNNLHMLGYTQNLSDLVNSGSEENNFVINVKMFEEAKQQE